MRIIKHLNPPNFQREIFDGIKKTKRQKKTTAMWCLRLIACQPPHHHLTYSLVSYGCGERSSSGSKTQRKVSFKIKSKKASDTHSSRDENIVYIDRSHTHTHAHVHLHSEANPFSKVEVRFSQIHRGCRNNIHQHYTDQTTPSRPPRVKGQFFGTQ